MIFFTSFYNDLEVRGVFLDISKAFDKVWHGKNIFKWSVLIMDKGECRRPTRMNFETFIVFDLRKQLVKWSTVQSQAF